MSISKAFKNPIILLVFFCIVEILLLSYCKNVFGYFIKPVIFFITSILIGVVPLFYFYGTKDYFDFIEEKFGVIIPDEEKIILPKRYIPEKEDYKQWWEITNE